MSAISVLNIGKAYKVYPTRFSRLKEWLMPLSKPRHTLKWVLQDVSFSVHPGEAVGIIGINGAGKSTLLKMLAGTTQPTTGSIEIKGRVAALLELGIGFHPQFTGRQNALMAGQLLGYSAKEIVDRMPEIEAFADIGDYIDQPVRVYSSGMQARLAFSVATTLRPDVLIVDEALSVGDLAFQAKCIERMKALLTSGVTILFVSHALNQVRQFCSRVIYITKGKARVFDSTSTACDHYQNDLATNTPIAISNSDGPTEMAASDELRVDDQLRSNSVEDIRGSMVLAFTAFDVFNERGQRISHCGPNDEVTLRASIRANSDAPAGAVVGLLIGDKSGYPLLSCNSNYYDVRLPSMKSGNWIAVTWRIRWPFYSGEFRIDIGIKPEAFSSVFYDRIFCARTLTTNTPVALAKENFGGVFYVEANVEISESP
jgi:lipopolysaccharide transport system ATP-binding protein